MMTTDSSPDQPQSGAQRRTVLHRALEPVDRIIPRIVPRIEERKDRARRDHKPETSHDDSDGRTDEPKPTTLPSKSDDGQEHRIDVVVRGRFLPTRQILPVSGDAVRLH
jgi:hypothetical protein